MHGSIIKNNKIKLFFLKILLFYSSVEILGIFLEVLVVLLKKLVLLFIIETVFLQLASLVMLQTCC